MFWSAATVLQPLYEPDQYGRNLREMSGDGQVIKPRRGRVVKIAPPPGHPIRAYVRAVVTDVAEEWVFAEVQQESWRFRAGTSLLLRRDKLLQVGHQLIAQDASIAAVYPPETQTTDYLMNVLNRLFSQEGETT